MLVANKLLNVTTEVVWVIKHHHTEISQIIATWAEM